MYKKKKIKYFYFCQEARKQTYIEGTDNGLVAIKNWNKVETLKNIKNKISIVWRDQDKTYNFNQVETLNNNIPNSDLKNN